MKKVESVAIDKSLKRNENKNKEFMVLAEKQKLEINAENSKMYNFA